MGTFLSPNLHGNSYYRNPISAYHHIQPVRMIQSSASLTILPVIAKSLDFVRRRQIIIPESSMTKYDVHAQIHFTSAAVLFGSSRLSIFSADVSPRQHAKRLLITLSPRNIRLYLTTVMPIRNIAEQG